MLLLLLPLAGSARMYPQQVPTTSICWDSFEEAVTYHKDILKEFPIGRGFINNPKGPTFGTILVNPETPSWTYVHFHQNIETGKQVVCAMASGTEWEHVASPDENNKVEM